MYSGAFGHGQVLPNVSDCVQNGLDGLRLGCDGSGSVHYVIRLGIFRCILM